MNINFDSREIKQLPSPSEVDGNVPPLERMKQQDLAPQEDGDQDAAETNSSSNAQQTKSETANRDIALQNFNHAFQKQQEGNGNTEHGYQQNHREDGGRQHNHLDSTAMSVQEIQKSDTRRLDSGMTSRTGTQNSANERTAQRAWRKLRNAFAVNRLARAEMDRRRDKRQAGVDLIQENALNILPAHMIGMHFSYDEHHNRRIPVLLNQLGIRITDSQQSDSKSRTVFRIELEYADGVRKWVIYRTFGDLANLHYSFRKRDPTRSKIPNFPKFPRNTIPYMRHRENTEPLDPEDSNGALRKPLEKQANYGGGRTGHRKEWDQSYESTNEENGQATGEGDADKDNDIRRGQSRQKRPTMNTMASNTSNFHLHDDDHNSEHVSEMDANQRARFAQLQRQQLEEYLIAVIRCLMFRPEANRICKFLEISALGTELALEGGYQGKEGYLTLSRSTDRVPIHGGRGPLCGVYAFVRQYRNKWQPKWFMVRDSYVVVVDEPHEINVWDVILVDSRFEVTRGEWRHKHPPFNKNPNNPSSHVIYIKNADRVIKVRAKNERQAVQFVDSMKMLSNPEQCLWSSKESRFGSFAPVRMGVNVQWLVDGRDYFWNVARAMAMAKETIYIEDWWLSVELYMRRPSAQNYKWRLDRLLKHKAEQGVKIYIVMYKEVSLALPLWSEYAKKKLLDLHPNIYVQRHPQHLGTTIKSVTFFWAHHEKICVVDNTIGFIGGLDLCFGRWDTPAHVLADDKTHNVGKDAEESQIWPGKDYSNPRVLDFHTLDEPYIDTVERSKVPRMPWHDVALQVVGQPARDIARHFVQRWNYLRRHKAPQRPTPFLLPKPDFNNAQLRDLNLTGTCEMQILRSVSPWSIGSLEHVEHSIHDTYVKCIDKAEHFIYIENQFFITSTVCGSTTIENQIGHALVKRILRAHKEGTPFRVICIIPLVPCFQSEIDSPDASSVRMIMHCQYRSICRGEHSIYGRLRAENINPDDYITFYSLRNWARLSGEFATEEVYIHSKMMVMDDRIAIIGSANINERSQRGSRDSEIAAVIRDTDMIQSQMAGKSYMVGKFAHSLRLRCMREHLGIDVDALEALEREKLDDDVKRHLLHGERDVDAIYKDDPDEQWDPKELKAMKDYKEGHAPRDERGQKSDQEGAMPVAPEKAELKHNDANASPETSPVSDKEPDFASEKPPNASTEPSAKAPTPTDADKKLEDGPSSPSSSEASSSSNNIDQNTPSTVATSTQETGKPLYEPERKQSTKFDAMKENKFWRNVKDEDISTDPLPEFGPDVFLDPLEPSFFINIWQRTANHNTDIFRKIFQVASVPDDCVTTWAEYKEFQSLVEKNVGSTEDVSTSGGQTREERVEEGGDPKRGEIDPRGKVVIDDKQSKKENKQELIEMERMLAEIRGHLVVFPTRFLEKEDAQGTWLFTKDKLAPLDIFT
ncbi:hypothetical protein BZG36_01841 [Bifiguratus adelaidae]|uniref:Phospholipase n=1 Tax=Bifiguratus adelaidae TaxID=1938954 RepID=A0A261Y2E4_9FUNG|nr:hypothetical protein BZG36_01841 [Bifiguratus adelaidae]